MQPNHLQLCSYGVIYKTYYSHGHAEYTAQEPIFISNNKNKFEIPLLELWEKLIPSKKGISYQEELRQK